MANTQSNALDDSAPSLRYTVIWIGFLVGFGFYAGDIIIDVFVFGNGTIIEQLVNPSYHEMWMRTCVLLISVTFSIYVQILLRRERTAVEHVKRTERFLSTVIDNIPSMIYIKDAKELRYVRINHTGEKLLGIRNQQLKGSNDYEFFPRSQADYFTSKDREVLESSISVNIPEEEIDTVALGKRWLHTRKVPILNDKGQAAYLLGVSDDITAAKKIAADLKKTEIRFRTLFDSAADFIFVIDIEGKIIEANRYSCEQSGYEKNEIIGEYIKNLFTEESHDACDNYLTILRERGYNRADFEFVCKDARIIQMECLATAVPDESGYFNSYLFIQRDVTDKNQAEKAMQRQQREMAHIMRLSTMGEMASGVAHELNQPLTALISYCGTAAALVNALPSPSPQLGEILKRAETQAHRAGQIIRHLRDFVAKDEDHKEAVELDIIIEGMIDFLKPELEHGQVSVEHHHGTRGNKVMANKIQIEQVLVNLVLNSQEAIRSSDNAIGNIVVETRLLPNKEIETRVIDNGPGIDADMAGKIFDPFQTSKSSGMGMGLSISRSIIEEHGGKLCSDAQHRDGALFSFTLPIAGET